MTDSVAREPCASCPYRQDVPSGVWERIEYEKLPNYDGEIVDQLLKGATAPFYCHQRDGNLCAGWLACHGSDELLAMRLHAGRFDESVWGYECETPLWASGQEACEHGVKDVDAPSEEAMELIERVSAKLERKNGGET